MACRAHVSSAARARNQAGNTSDPGQNHEKFQPHAGELVDLSHKIRRRKPSNGHGGTSDTVNRQKSAAPANDKAKTPEKGVDPVRIPVRSKIRANYA